VTTVWVFNGNKNHFPSGVFSTRQRAEQWILQHKLEGTLTEYPLDVSVHEWAIQTGRFKPKKPEHHTNDFIANFSSASQEHHHYEKSDYEEA
jgi:hypothetical protein